MVSAEGTGNHKGEEARLYNPFIIRDSISGFRVSFHLRFPGLPGEGRLAGFAMREDGKGAPPRASYWTLIRMKRWVANAAETGSRTVRTVRSAWSIAEVTAGAAKPSGLVQIVVQLPGSKLPETSTE